MFFNLVPVAPAAEKKNIIATTDEDVKRVQLVFALSLIPFEEENTFYEDSLYYVTMLRNLP